MRWWWKFQAWRWTKRARFAKAHWLALEQTIKRDTTSGGMYCPIKRAESRYCDTVVKVKTYQMLLNPEIPRANVIDIKEARP